MFDAAGLRVMRAIADHGSFTAAAQSLGYTQPAISQMVRRLEERSGTVLVERNGRSVRLTQAGRVLARHAVNVLAALDNAEAEIASIAGLQSGRVRLMAFPSSSATLVPRALAKVKTEFPGVTVSFSEGEPPQSLAAIREGTKDLAVAFVYDDDDPIKGDDDLTGLVVLDVMVDPVRIALPANHRLAELAVVPLHELTDESWIAGCERCRGHLLALAGRNDFVPDVSFETEDYVAVLGLVAAGLGVALVPELILHSASHPGVVTRSISPSSKRTIRIVTTPDLQRVPAVSATLDALCASAREIQSEPMRDGTPSGYPALST
ncbi:LysR family transcriptional regulator [Ornithinimicrobium sp. INDO-MA30-4]|uniref:LysR family transcriptional regulator n=1 Tax=Ornithinimicrobium sp. INDO-MA30-4 TaxID=2908651 RepID=UPI001F29F9D1|nr:LysR family transcriptional regulator [Ornithinimicrobium sp. INDO-MA30-4]UJH71382.1 LysR family transcriptional regulator [Ornithinimicrobium sp. INDO-MA30-4]